MRKRRILWLAILASLAALILFLYVASISHPCPKRLKKVAAVLNEIWSDQNLIAQLKTSEDYQRVLRERVNEPLACPDNAKPYLFFPKEGIVLADAQPHGIRKSWLVIEWRHTEGGEKFRVVTWSPITTTTPKPLPSFFQIFFEFIQSLTSWINPPFRPSPINCPTNLRNVSLALAMYIVDYDELFPPMKDVAVTQLVLLPYIRNMNTFFCPTTKQPYYPNPHLHHKPLPNIYYPAETPSFYETVIHPDGLRGIAFADSHVKFVTPHQWQTIQERFQLPLPP